MEDKNMVYLRLYNIFGSKRERDEVGLVVASTKMALSTASAS